MCHSACCILELEESQPARFPETGNPFQPLTTVIVRLVVLSEHRKLETKRNEATAVDWYEGTTSSH